MKRRSNSPESLDLLLDTICNLFGLIILITILIAILVQISGQEAMNNIAQQPESKVRKTEELKQEKDLLTEEINKINTADLLKALAIRADAERKLKRAKNERERRIKMLDEENKLLDEDEELVQKLKEQLPYLQDEIEMLEEELKRSESTKDIKLRTPKRREVEDLMPVHVVLKDNRAYIINDTTGWGTSATPKTYRCYVWKTWNPDAVDISKTPIPIYHKMCYADGGQDIERTVYLLPQGGIPVPTTTSVDNDFRWVQFLNSLNPKHHIISLTVDPNSFEAFTEIRRSVTQAEFHYHVEPMVVPNPYRDRIKDDHHAIAH
jgi:hypothetical protein